MNTLSGLGSTGSYFNQLLTLSTTPTDVFTTFNWVALRNLLMGVLTNPFFYGIIGIIVIMTILPTVDDD